MVCHLLPFARVGQYCLNWITHVRAEVYWGFLQAAMLEDISTWVLPNLIMQTDMDIQGSHHRIPWISRAVTTEYPGYPGQSPQTTLDIQGSHHNTLDIQGNHHRLPWISRAVTTEYPGYPGQSPHTTLDIQGSHHRIPWISRAVITDYPGYPGQSPQTTLDIQGSHHRLTWISRAVMHTIFARIMCLSHRWRSSWRYFYAQ